MRVPRFRDAVADLAAPLHDEPKDALIGEDIRQHRRTMLLTRGAIAILLCLLSLSIAASVAAFAQASRAEREQCVATARSLMFQADNLRARRPIDALRLGLAADDIQPGNEARSGLVRTLTESRYLATLNSGQSASVAATALSPNGRHALTAVGSDGVLWDVNDRYRPRQLARIPGRKKGVGWSRSTRRAAPPL